MSARKSSRVSYVPARAVVKEVERISPNFARITLTGPEVNRIGTPNDVYDVRIKVGFPPSGGTLPDFTTSGPEGWQEYFALPTAERGPIRTLSIRELRVDGADTELVIDFVLHLEPGATGPASRWAARAVPGDEVIVLGPQRGRTDRSGIEYDPGDATTVVLAGDETAAPAIARILEDAPRDLQGVAFVEVPEYADQLAIDAPPDVEVRWLPRSGSPHGTRLLPAVLNYLDAPAPEHALVSDTEIAAAEGVDLVWETPGYSGLGEPVFGTMPNARRYFWIAGESGVVTTLRRHLVNELGIDRGQVAFMGYWRRGVAMAG